MSKIEIEIPKGYFFDKETMSIKKFPEPEFVYVDLGLPSGTKWATRNIGAEKETDFGSYLSFESAQKYNCPSIEQIEEMVENTTSVWLDKNEVNGRMFIGKNGNHIFIPAAGGCFEDVLYNESLVGFYWSSTLVSVNINLAYILSFRPDNIYPYNNNYRYNKFSVRPVKQ